MLNKIRTSPEILASKVDHVAARKEIQFLKFYKFWLWRQEPENWQLTRGFPVWFFLSWGIDYWIKSEKSKCGTFNHPISPYFPLCCREPSKHQKTCIRKKSVELFSRYRPIVAIYWLSRELDRFEPTFQAYCTNFSPIVTEKKAKTNFDPIVSFFHCFRKHFISFCNILWNLSVEVGTSSKICRKTWNFFISANKSKTDETISKNSILEDKKSGQKSKTLAHSGGHNLVKISVCIFFSHYGSKVFAICLKN